MPTTDNLVRAFDALERLAPDTDAALAELTTRLDKAGHARAYAAGGLAVTGVVAVTALALSGTVQEPVPGPIAIPAPTTGRPSGSSSTAILRQVAFSTRLATAPGADGITRPVVTVGAGWLPTGATLLHTAADDSPGNGGAKRWTVPYRDGRGTFDVGVAVNGGADLPTGSFMTGPGRDLTVAGRPARLFTGDFVTVVYIKLGASQIAKAEVFSDPARQNPTAAVAIVEHVAREMTYGRRDPLRVTAVLTAAPVGDTIVAVDTTLDARYPSTYYRLNDLDTGAEIGIGNMAEKHPAALNGTPGRTVQGRPSLVIRDGRRTILYIDGLFGDFTKLISGDGAETLTDLYRIAAGIRAVT